MKKVVVISGGSDGLGKEVARKLTSKCIVVILSPDKEKVQTASLELKCDFEVCDVADYKSVKNAIEFIINKHGRIDCLVNNAGLWIEGELDENDPKRMKEVIEVNALGTMYLSKAAIPFMKKEKKGLIINIISQAGIYAKPLRTVYHATKWAMTGFTKSLQIELVKYGIGVTGVYPGKMNTQMFEKVGIHKEMHDAVDPKEVAKIIEFILSFDHQTIFPEIGIKHIKG